MKSTRTILLKMEYRENSTTDFHSWRKVYKARFFRACFLICSGSSPSSESDIVESIDCTSFLFPFLSFFLQPLLLLYGTSWLELSQPSWSPSKSCSSSSQFNWSAFLARLYLYFWLSKPLIFLITYNKCCKYDYHHFIAYECERDGFGGGEFKHSFAGFQIISLQWRVSVGNEGRFGWLVEQPPISMCLRMIWSKNSKMESFCVGEYAFHISGDVLYLEFSLIWNWSCFNRLDGNFDSCSVSDFKTWKRSTDLNDLLIRSFSNFRSSNALRNFRNHSQITHTHKITHKS